MADLAVLTLKIVSDKADEALRRTDALAKRLDKTATRTKASLRGIGLGLSATVTAPMLLAGRAALRAASEFEQARVAFGVFVGDVQKGTQIFKDLVQFSAQTPLNLSGLQQASQILLATGIQADNLMGILKSLGDVSRGNSSILQRLALNLGQVRSQGRLTGRELRDFAVAGVPLVQTLAEQFGKTTEEIRSMVSAGQVGFADVVKAFQRMTGDGGKFNGLLEKMAETLTGKFTTAVDNVRIALASFVEPFEEQIKGVLDLIITWSRRVQSMSAEMKKAFVVVAGLAAAVGPAILLIAGLTSTVAVAAATLLAKLALVATAVEGFRRLVGITWKEIGEGIMSTIGFFVNFRANWEILTNFIRDQWQNIMSDIIRAAIVAGKNLVDNIKVAINKMAAIIGAVGTFFVSNWEVSLVKVITAFTSFASSILNGIFKLAGRISAIMAQALIGAFTGEGVDLDVSKFFNLGALAGATETTIEDAVKKALEGTGSFKDLLDGFERTTADFPGFITNFGNWVGQLSDEINKSINIAGDDAAGDTASGKLAEALRAGSSEAFKALTSGRGTDQGAKDRKKNLKANEKTAKSIDDILQGGIPLRDVKAVSSFDLAGGLA